LVGEASAKFFVNRGVVSSRADVYHLLRPLIKHPVAYRYFRGQDLVGRGTGIVERIVLDRPDMSSYFTPMSICVNVDSFEYLEFETRPDQLIWYTLVQGDERVVLEFMPAGSGDDADDDLQQTLDLDSDAYVQMELGGLDAPDAGESGSGREAGEV